jgi:hypothetical protein
MSTSVKRIGAARLSALPDGFTRELAASGSTTTLVLHGPYALCHDAQAERFPIGGGVAGFSGRIASATLATDEGGLGRLTVVFEDARPEDLDGQASDADAAPQYSVQMVSESLPLEAHPRYNPRGSELGEWEGASMATDVLYYYSEMDAEAQLIWERLFGEQVHAFSDSVGGIIAKLKRASLEEKKFYTSGLEENVGDLIDDFFEKWEAGQESFQRAFPVLRKTSETYLAPQLGRVNFIDLAVAGEFGRLCPKMAGGENFQFLKVADSADRTGKSGKIRRVEEWKGAEQWDPDIYPPA